jgi:ribosomal protein L12E/L44/L45/RPP1/RPP2
MNFTEKNNLVIKHTSADEFYRDLELFKKRCPNDRLNHDLARANQITHARLDGSMLLRLLDKVPIDEILQNRQTLKTPPPSAVPDAVPTVPDDKETTVEKKKKENNEA